MKKFWRGIVTASLPFTLLPVLLTFGLVGCTGGGYVSGPERPPPYDDEIDGGDDFGGGDFGENGNDDSGGGDREDGGESDGGEGVERD
ncbi:MAG: hypothetical protein WAO07_03635 [Desulfobacterales bacterium]